MLLHLQAKALAKAVADFGVWKEKITKQNDKRTVPADGHDQ